MPFVLLKLVAGLDYVLVFRLDVPSCYVQAAALLAISPGHVRLVSNIHTKSISSSFVRHFLHTCYIYFQYITTPASGLLRSLPRISRGGAYCAFTFNYPMRWLVAVALTLRASCVVGMPATPTAGTAPPDAGPTPPSEPAITLQDRVDHLVDFLKQPQYALLLSFLVGGVSSALLTSFAYEVLTGQVGIPGQKLIDKIQTHWVPDECASLKDPKINEPDFQAATGGKYPPRADETIDKDVKDHQMDEYDGFVAGMKNGRSLRHGRQRQLHLEGVQEGMKSYQGVPFGPFALADNVRMRTNMITAGDEARAYTNGQRENREYRHLRPWSQQQIFLEGRETGTTLLDEHQRAKPLSLLRGYSRGLCVSRCVQAEKRVVSNQRSS